MNDPRIYTVVEAPILGQLGEATDMVEGPLCPTCNAPPLKTIAYLDYVLDYWEGEPLIGVAEVFAVTEDLRDALEISGLSGFSFRAMTAAYGDTYDPEPGDPELVRFWQLVIDHRIHAGSGWWTRVGVCPSCGRARWEANAFTSRAIVRAHQDLEVPPRTVVRSGYGGWDIFYLDDPGPAIITERMRDFLLAHGVVRLALQEAVFIDTPEAL